MNLYWDNSAIFELVDLLNDVTGAAIDDATVSLSVVSGETVLFGPADMDSIGDGLYRYEMTADDVNSLFTQRYPKLKVSATNEAGDQALWTASLSIRDRGNFQ